MTIKKQVIQVNVTQITTELKEAFNEPLKDWEQRKIVFWTDTEEEFTEEIEQLSIPNVKIEVLTAHNQFYMKHLLEAEDPASSYLIYTNMELNMEDNWLLDTVLYSKTFFADRVSILLNELGIDPSLRAVVKKYERFFRSKERTRKFQTLEVETYTEETIELAMMSALCNIKTLDFESVLKTVLMDTLDDKENKYLAQMEKFFDVKTFWAYVQGQYGYEREVKTLETLFMHLTITAFQHTVREDYLTVVQDFIATTNKTNAYVFVDRWMHHKRDHVVFNEYAKKVEREIQLPSILQAIPIDDFKQADTFPYVDKAIIMHIANNLLDDLEDYAEYLKLIRLRRVKHYYEQYAAIYEGLYYTVKMHEFYKAYPAGIPSGQASEMYEVYAKEYYVMDTYYRKFYVAYDKESNHDVLKKLKELVEGLYTNWFMGETSSNWSRSVKAEMTEQWSLPDVTSQQKFYQTYIEPHVRKNERAFVIISDAMRYEVGVELAERLNAETIGSCTIETMLGVVPSVTKLGMAALLPHRSLDIDGQGRVRVDEKDSSGIENRARIIESHVEESVTIHAQELLSMSSTSRREGFKGKKLFYIYHDTIDAMGDKASTELYTFDAVETALAQLSELVRMIRSDLSGTNVYITADHGFLYQRETLEESDKIINELTDAVEVKRRYMLAKDQREISGQLAIDLTSVVKNEEGFTVYVPNGTIRNRMQGTGVNFVHGGASLQEIVVPVVTFKNKRPGQKGVQEVQQVDIRLTSTTRRITNSIFHLDFFQTEKVEDKTTARTVEIYMADEAGAVLSNEETIIGDRASDNPTERTFKVQFVLENRSYDRNKTYYLLIKDAETGVIREKVPFTINLGIISDFDF